MSWRTEGDALAARQSTAVEAPHIRAARALLGWSAQQLADVSKVSFSTVRRMEVDTGSVRAEAINRVKDTLEFYGIRFLLTADDHLSVTLVPSTSID